MLCSALAACKPASTQTAADVRVVGAKPRCEELGVIEGVGGNAEHARKNALAVLEPAHPDLEDGMTIVVTGAIFACPPPGEVLPPDGYQ